MAIQNSNAHSRNLTHGSLTIQDASGTPKGILIALDEGNLRFTVTNPAAVVMNRGTLSHFTQMPQVPVSIQFTVKFAEWKGLGFSGAAPSPYEALTLTGNASAWTSTETCGPKTSNLVFALTNPCSGAGTGIDQIETLTFTDFHADTIEFNEGEQYDTLIVSGTALITAPSSVRSGT